MFINAMNNSAIVFNHDNKANNLKGKNKAIIAKNSFRSQRIFIYLMCDSNFLRFI